MTTILSEAEFKSVMENKLLVLIQHGSWATDVEHEIKMLKYQDKYELYVNMHLRTIEVVTGGHKVELSNSTLVDTVKELYYTTLCREEEKAKVKLQQDVLSVVNHLASKLELT